MPQGDKSSYIDNQKRQAAHIEAGYEQRGASVKTSEARAWATVSKLSGGGKRAALAGRELLLLRCLLRRLLLRRLLLGGLLGHGLIPFRSPTELVSHLTDE